MNYKRIYLDHAATTPIDSRVKDAMEPFWDEKFGNAGGLYEEGRLAKEAMQNSRETITKFIGAKPDEIIFTSGGTESDNLAVFGVAEAALKNLPKAEIFQDFSQRDGARLSNSPAGEYAGLEKSAAEAKPHARIILFVHRLSKRKGADLIPEIANGFGDDALFLMIGDGPEFENLKLKIENSSLKNIKLLGQVPNKDITWYFHSSSIFLMPSREEGSPHVILEAMASGVPFIASDIGGVREIVPKEFERFLCPSEDVKCFQDKIKTLLANSGLYENTRAQCLNHAQKFDISRGINEFIDLFK